MDRIDWVNDPIRVAFPEAFSAKAWSTAETIGDTANPAIAALAKSTRYCFELNPRAGLSGYGCDDDGVVVVVVDVVVVGMKCGKGAVVVAVDASGWVLGGVLPNSVGEEDIGRKK